MTINIDQAKAQLDQLIDRLAPGESVTITRGGKAVATLFPAVNGTVVTPRFGLAKGAITVIAEDEDHLTDFRDYMPS